MLKLNRSISKNIPDLQIFAKFFEKISKNHPQEIIGNGLSKHAVKAKIPATFVAGIFGL
jgi:hypothetical protein